MPAYSTGRCPNGFRRSLGAEPPTKDGAEEIDIVIIREHGLTGGWQALFRWSRPISPRCWKPDVPAGVVNIVTGGRDGLVKVLAEHEDVDALWVFGSKAASTVAERLSVGNLKRTLVDHGPMTDWFDAAPAEGPILLRHAVQMKNIWTPHGD